MFPCLIAEIEHGPKDKALTSPPLADCSNSAIRVLLPDDAQINANGSLRLFLDDALRTYNSHRGDFSHRSMTGPDQGQSFMVWVEIVADAVQRVKAMREELEDGFIATATTDSVEVDDLWQRMARWEIQEMVRAVAKLEIMHRQDSQ